MNGTTGEDTIKTESSIFFNRNPSEKNVLRCPKCHLIPYIYFDPSTEILKYSCPNGHSQKGEINLIYSILKSNQNNIKCFSCQRYANKYCSKCFNYFCNSCGIKESEKDEHYVVDIESMDKVCFEHNDSANIYCPIEKKSICDFCCNLHNKHKLIQIRDLVISNSKINEYKYKVNKLHNNSSNKFIINCLNELQCLLSSYIKKIKDVIYDLNKNNINAYISLLSDLLFSYEFKISKKCLNYNNINNIIINFNNNELKNINSNKILYTNIYNEIKNNLNNLDEIDKTYESKNYINFKLYDKHKSSIYKLLTLNNGKIASASADNTIIIFNEKTFEKEIEINEHNSYIFNLIQLSNDILISCSADRKVNFIRLNENDNSYEIIQTYKSEIIYDVISTFMELKNGKLLSGNLNIYLNEIKVWNNNYNKIITNNGDSDNDSNNIKNFEIEKKIKLIDEKGITDIIEIKDNIIVFDQILKNNMNNYITFYNLETNRKIRDIKIKYINIYFGKTKFILINDDTLLLEGIKEYIYVININTYQLINTIICDIDNHFVCLYKLENNIFLSGNKDYLYKWKFNEFSKRIIVLEQIKAHENFFVTAITVTKDNKKNNIFVTGSDDKIIKFWK